MAMLMTRFEDLYRIGEFPVMHWGKLGLLPSDNYDGTYNDVIIARWP